MLLYTILPAEMVLAEEEARSFVDVHIGGIMIQVEPVSDDRGKVVRICSSDPQHYLIPGLQPGDMVSFSRVAPGSDRWLPGGLTAPGKASQGVPYR